MKKQKLEEEEIEEFKKYVDSNLRNEKSVDYITEFEDSEDFFQEKMENVVEVMKNSKYITFLTGAGISVNCGLSDYRGTNGIWTKRVKGEEYTKLEDLNFASLEPSFTHKSLFELSEKQILKFLISTNVDNLHCKSGFKRISENGNLCEMHGNLFIEECGNCLKEFKRDFMVRNEQNGIFEHQTDRLCENCGTKSLRDVIVNFGNDYTHVPSLEKQYDAAWSHCLKSDLIIVLGSSLSLTETYDLIDDCLNKGGKLIICNKQNTPKDTMASITIHSDCDKFMKEIMKYY
eukprot:gene5503-9320_t